MKLFTLKEFVFFFLFKENILRSFLKLNIRKYLFTEIMIIFFLNKVPVGHKLEVLTQGKGLGQMHVNVEYNVPVDRNANCHFNISVEVKQTQIPSTSKEDIMR